MALIGEISNATSNLNTGFSNASWEPDLIIGSIFVPKGWYATNTDVADPDFINDLIHQDNPLLRGLPSPEYVGIEPNNTEASKEQFVYGGSERAGIDQASWMLKFRKGKMCAYKNMASLDGLQEKFDKLFVDRKGRLLGYKKVVANEVRMYGFSLSDIYAPLWTPGTNSNNPDYKMEYSFADTTQLKNNIIAVELGLQYSDLDPIEDMTIEFYSSASGGIFQFYLRDSAGANLGETYGSTLADVTLFLAYNRTTGAAITGSSMTYSAITKRYTLDLDQTDTDFSTTANNILIKGAAPSAFAAEDVMWYANEGANQLIVTGIS